METKAINERLAAIQRELSVPKSHYNQFGKYAYRKLEDIMEAVKPILSGLTLTISDSVKQTGDFVYIEATATLSDGANQITVSACAGIEKAGGMQLAQAFGASSSYARKYALNGLFAIDDTQDPDEANKGAEAKKTATQPAPQAPAPTSKKWVQPSPKSTRENLTAAGWDGKTIKMAEGKPYVETSKAFVELSQKQFEAFKNV